MIIRKSSTDWRRCAVDVADIHIHEQTWFWTTIHIPATDGEGESSYYSICLDRNEIRRLYEATLAAGSPKEAV